MWSARNRLKNTLLFRISLYSALSQITNCSMSAKADSILKPPEHVRGMTTLDKTAFDTTVLTPYMKIPSLKMGQATKFLKKYLLKMEQLKPVRDCDQNPSDKIVLLNPDMVDDYASLDQTAQSNLKALGIGQESYGQRPVSLGYDNFKTETILKAILPEDIEGASSFSRIGHIIHLNLREHLLQHRFLIGKIFLDKMKGVRSVVNKSNIITNEYRNFQMEVLAGDDDMVVRVKENNCMFDFDFAKVFWNPRLSSEHERMIEKVKAKDVMYDVFAGVGPFAIPAAKKGCVVLANDLNPHSFDWLKHNIKLNKVSEQVTAYNLDGLEFIKTVLKDDLISRWKAKTSGIDVHILMNLPATAVEFLATFMGLCSDTELQELKSVAFSPVIHCYCFVHGLEDLEKDAVQMVNHAMKGTIEKDVLEVKHVRSVAPAKEMMRVTFTLDKDIIFCNPPDCNTEIDYCPPAAKRQCQTNVSEITQ